MSAGPSAAQSIIINTSPVSITARDGGSGTLETSPETPLTGVLKVIVIGGWEQILQTSPMS